MHVNLDRQAVLAALHRAWSRSSARQWAADNPAQGQCNVTTLLIHDLYGGTLLKTPLPEGDHFYNRIGSARIDFTASQFDRPIRYADLPADRAEVERGATNAELDVLKSAFLRELP